MSNQQHVLILGAGPAGVGAAFRLAHQGSCQVTVLEQTSRAGGNAGSFEWEGFRVDYGSHRLHPACDAEVFDDIRRLLKQDLLERRRHGRIFLKGQWVHFPLRASELIFSLPLEFSLGAMRDILLKPFLSTHEIERTETFAAVLEHGLGRTICEDFYFPYARKIWGLAPDLIDADQAHRRVSAGTVGGLLRKIARAAPVVGQGPPRFYYPRLGYGQIPEAYCQAAVASGAHLHLNSRVLSIKKSGRTGWTVQFQNEGQLHELQAEHVWSTIPITVLMRCLESIAPTDCLRAAEGMGFRSMILIYLLLETEQFTEYDAHYFPSLEIPISRLSEPKNYSGGNGPSGRTVLCAELPCSVEDKYWGMRDDKLGGMVIESLARAGLPVRVRVKGTLIRKLRYAYPLYARGYSKYFQVLDEWLNAQRGLISFGRQGLFAHDNTHHALYMAYSAAKCMAGGRFNRERWQEYRKIFDSHVVED